MKTRSCLTSAFAIISHSFFTVFQSMMLLNSNIHRPLFCLTGGIAIISHCFFQGFHAYDVINSNIPNLSCRDPN